MTDSQGGSTVNRSIDIDQYYCLRISYLRLAQGSFEYYAARK